MLGPEFKLNHVHSRVVDELINVSRFGLRCDGMRKWRIEGDQEVGRGVVAGEGRN